MAIRLQSEFRTLNDDQYRIKIFDSAYLGNPVDVNVGGDGFTLTHDGETDAVYSPIVGSSVTLTIYNNDSAIDSFRTALLNAQDKQFSLRILRAKNPVIQYKERVEADGGTIEAMNCVTSAINALGGSTTIPDSEFDLYWTGYIAQDLIEEADESKPRAISLRAADGISIISTIDYQFNAANSFDKTFKDIVVEILTDANINDLFESDETMLTSVVNWYAEQHTYSSTMDPMDNTKTDLKSFVSWTSGGVREYTNALQVIREIATITNSRFYFDDGSFRFEQISERDNINVREFYYLNDGTSNGNAVVQLDTLIDQDTAHRSNGTFRYLPAIKKVSLTQNRLSSANIIGRSVIFPTDEIDVGIIPSADNGRLILQIKTQVQTYISNPLQGTATPVFDVTIRLEPSDGTANQYWKNSFIVNSLVFGTGSWSTTLDTFKFAGNTISRSSSLKTSTQYGMTTGPLPKDGEIYIDIAFKGFYDFGLDPTFISSPNAFSWTATLQTAQFENDNNPSAIVQSIFEANNASTALGSNITVDLGETRLGDGAGAVGSLYVFTGSAWIPSTGWRVGNSGTYIDIAKLATRETLGLQSRVVHRYEGTIINGGAFKKRLRFDSLYWLPMRSTLTANTDELNVEAFKIARVIDDVDISSGPIEIGDDTLVVGVADFNGMYSNVGSGSLGGMLVDVDNAAVGPFSETATGGQITGSALVTGDITTSGNVTAVDVNASGNVSATDVEASGDVLADGAVNADSVNAANDVSGNTLSATTSVSSATLTTTGDATIGGNVSATDVGATNITASNNITASGLLTAGNASLDNFVTKTAIIGSSALVDSFKTRVENDGGTFEAFAAVLDAITPLLIGTAEKSAIVYGETSVETLDASNNITAAGNVSATNVNASNNATIGGALGVTGSTTLTGDTTLESTLNHQGQLIQQITDVTHSSGSTYDVGDTEYMIFNTWTGGNGTATINLPRAGDNEGRLLRFKSDGTISSNTSIALTPASPDTIDGNAEFSFNRDYDGVMILAHNSNWFIIQRKAK